MTIPSSASTAYCQNCGAAYSTNDTTEMHHFSPKPAGVEVISPAMILDAGSLIEHCPKCPLPDIDAAMRTGDFRPHTGEV